VLAPAFALDADGTGSTNIFFIDGERRLALLR